MADYKVTSKINALRTRRRERGALTAEEQEELGRLIAQLDGTETWRAYLGDWLMGEGSTEEAAIEAAAAEYEQSIGYATGDEEDDPRSRSREDLIARLYVCLAEED